MLRRQPRSTRTDTLFPYTPLFRSDEPNPALGLRGVRLSLARAGIFETQMRAIVRASGYGPVRVLVPMVSSRDEITAVAALLKRVRRDLASEGHEIRSEEHTSELQSLMRISYAVFCLKKKIK